MAEMKKTIRKKPTFLRRSVDRYSKLGVRRKKKQVWRKPTGRDNKMREKRRGYPLVVSIGYKSKDKETPKIIKNLKELEKFKGKEIILGKIGKKKKLEIAKFAKDKKIEIKNMNPKTYLKRNKKIKGEEKK